MRLCERNMAGGVTDKRKQKQRGRYKEYLRHYNPYKFKAARRTNRRKLKSQTNDPNSTISHGDFNSFVLLLTFVMKHKLTCEAFNDLLLVIEAHCPRPNNCKTSVKKLLEFASQANGDLEKHYFCDYCKAYFGKDTGNCKICGQRISKESGFFIEVPVEKQLKMFFTGKFPFLYHESCHVMSTSMA